MTAAKETIDQTRRRLASPDWRRQEREGHAVGILLLVLPSLLGAGIATAGPHPLGLLVSVVFLVAEPALLWRIGPRFGFDRRAAFLVALPVLGLFVPRRLRLAPRPLPHPHLEVDRAHLGPERLGSAHRRRHPQLDLVADTSHPGLKGLPRRGTSPPLWRYSSAGMGDIRELRPRGYYLAHEAGWLAGVSGDRIGQWARRGYIRSSISTGVPRVYSYQDVAEAMVVHELEGGGVPLPAIRRAVQLLREEYGDWPLTEAPLVTARLHGSGGDQAAALALEHADGGLTDLHRQPRHGLLPLGDVRRIARDLRRGGWAVRGLPELRSIEVDPDRLSGRPVISGTRVPAELVAQLARTEAGQKILRSDYGVTAQQIRDATTWWRAVEELAAAA